MAFYPLPSPFDVSRETLEFVPRKTSPAEDFSSASSGPVKSAARGAVSDVLPEYVLLVVVMVEPYWPPKGRQRIDTRFMEDERTDWFVNDGTVRDIQESHEVVSYRNHAKNRADEMSRGTFNENRISIGGVPPNVVETLIGRS